MMDDVLVNRETVLEIVLKGLHIPREVYELRYSLFLRATRFYFSTKRTSEVLEPFPTCLYDFATKTRLYDDLENFVDEIPQLKDINVRTADFLSIWLMIKRD